MSYRYKVGDKGLTGAGSEYEVLSTHWVRGKEVVVCKLATAGSEWVSVYPQGSVALVPPVRRWTYYANVYDNDAILHQTAAEAEGSADADALAVAFPVVIELPPKE